MKIIECPRDAMQGIEEFIPTSTKIEYINKLLQVGFDTIDFGSFVSPRAIPQLKDTADVIKHLDLSKTKTKLLAIIGNERGATDACSFEEVDYLGFPFSISEEFLKRNINSTIEQSFDRLKAIQEITVRNNKQLVIYISMAFGNPYGENWHPELVSEWSEKLSNEGISIISLADTIGVSTPESIQTLYKTVSKDNSNIEIGLHLHSNPKNSSDKIRAAIEAGCTRIDSAIRGFGGCPMAEDDLVGNIATEEVIKEITNNSQLTIDLQKFEKAINFSHKVFK
ncbi:MAG: hydroxymethylglutaryl-CoA lyase [Chlorobiota bacterium]